MRQNPIVIVRYNPSLVFSIYFVYIFLLSDGMRVADIDEKYKENLHINFF